MKNLYTTFYPPWEAQYNGQQNDTKKQQMQLFNFLLLGKPDFDIFVKQFKVRLITIPHHKHDSLRNVNPLHFMYGVAGLSSRAQFSFILLTYANHHAIAFTITENTQDTKYLQQIIHIVLNIN